MGRPAPTCSSTSPGRRPSSSSSRSAPTARPSFRSAVPARRRRGSTWTRPGSFRGTSYTFVQVQDDPNQGSHTGPETGGADIDAICGFNVANRSPVAVNDSARFEAGADYVANVLANDSDPDPTNRLAIESFTQPAGGIGVVSVDAAGNATFVPTDADFSGEVVFTYTVIDGQGGRATATVTFIIGGVPPSPSASPSTLPSASASASESASASASVSAPPSVLPSVSAEPSESDLPSAVDSPSPSSQTSQEPSVEPSPTQSDEPSPAESIEPSPAGSTVPSPSESVAPSAEGPVIEPVPSEPASPVAEVILFDGIVEVPVDGELSGDLATLIDNPDGAPVTFTPVLPPASGEVVIDPAGPFSYVPFTGFLGSDTFTFSLTVDGGEPAVAQVVISVAADCMDGPRPNWRWGRPSPAMGRTSAWRSSVPAPHWPGPGPGRSWPGARPSPSSLVLAIPAPVVGMAAVLEAAAGTLAAGMPVVAAAAVLETVAAGPLAVRGPGQLTAEERSICQIPVQGRQGAIRHRSPGSSSGSRRC